MLPDLQSPARPNWPSFDEEPAAGEPQAAPATPQTTRLLIPTEQLAPSPFNQRRLTGSEPDIVSLGESLATEGQLQDLLVRPMTEHTAQRAGDWEAGCRYQIAAGHRRHAAALAKDLPALWCVVRALSDEEMRRVHLVENRQRDSLKALEEAEAIALMHKDLPSYREIGKRLGMSASAVAGRMKLVDLSEEVRQALVAGDIEASVAELIARVNPKLQPAALKRCLERGARDGGKNSYRRIRDDLAERFTLEIKDAIFDTTDAELIPNAPACTECPKRSGAHPDLFADLITPQEDSYHRRKGKDVCTDEVCWDEKKKAHLKVEAAKLEAKGKPVVAGNAARQAVSAAGEVKGAYVELKDVKAELAKVKAKAPDKVPEVVLIQDPRTGKVKQAVKREDLKAAGVKVESSERAGPQRSWEEQERKRRELRERNDAIAEHEGKFRRYLMSQARGFYATGERTTEELRRAVRWALQHVGWHHRAALCWLQGWKAMPDEKAMDRLLAGLSPDALGVLLVDISLVDELRAEFADFSRSKLEPAPLLLAVAAERGLDAAAIRAEWEARNPLQGAARAEDKATPQAQGKAKSKKKKSAPADAGGGEDE